MEPTEANLSSGCANHDVSSIGVSNQLAETSADVHPTTALVHPTMESSSLSQYGLLVAYPQKRPDNRGKPFQESTKHLGPGCHPRTQAPVLDTGVSNCYVFKSRLQEYAQKSGLPTPIYETIREGPSHEPSFRSSVIVDGVKYDSLVGFFNRKGAEQSAAEVALMELSSSGENNVSIPVHETGLCKNVLQEYAQKMNYAIPTYICKTEDKPNTASRTPLFSCTVDIGGIQYIGAAAITKKEAEKKAARTALLAIRSSKSVGDEPGGKTSYTVLPCRRKVPEIAPPKPKTSKRKKSKNPRLKNKRLKKMLPGFSDNQTEAENMAMHVNNNMGIPVVDQNVQVGNNGQSIHSPKSLGQVNASTSLVARIGEPSGGEGPACQFTNFQQGEVITSVLPGFSDNQTEAENMATYVKNNVGNPVVDQNVQVGNNGQSIHSPKSSGQVNTPTSLVARIGEPSGGEGPACQLTNFQQGDVNTSLECSASLTNAKSNNGSTDITPMMKAPVSSQLDALLPEYVVNPGNNDNGVGNIASLMNTRASTQTDCLTSGSRIGDGRAAGPTDAKALLPADGTLDHVIPPNASPLRQESNTGTCENQN